MPDAIAARKTRRSDPRGPGDLHGLTEEEVPGAVGFLGDGLLFVDTTPFDRPRLIRRPAGEVAFEPLARLPREC